MNPTTIQRRRFCADFWAELIPLGIRAEHPVRGLGLHSVAWAEDRTLNLLTVEDFNSSTYPGITRIYVNCRGWKSRGPSQSLLRRLNLPPYPGHPENHAEITMLHAELPYWAGWLASLYAGRTDTIDAPPGCARQQAAWPKTRDEALSAIGYLWTDAAEREADRLNELRGKRGGCRS